MLHSILQSMNYGSFQICFSFPHGGCCEIFMQLHISRDMSLKVTEEEHTCDKISFEITGLKLGEKRSGNTSQ